MMGVKPYYKDARFVLAASVFAVFFLFTRFWELGVKPYHHDESLYAIESWRYASQGLYRFNPMLHGPLLFHLQALLFKVLPVTDYTGRLPVALAGLFLTLGGCFLFRRKPFSLLVWLAVMAFSPIMAYFSRFLGMDALLACLAIWLLICLIQLEKTHKALYLYLSFGLASAMYCTKLNSLFYFFAFFSFLLVWLRFNPAVRDRFTFLKEFKLHWLGASALGIGIFVLLFSSLGQNWGGVLDGLYRTMIPYWVKQHSLQRIKGPFHYYFPYLVLYELPILLILSWAFVSTRFTTKKVAKGTILFGWGLLLIWGMSYLLWKPVQPFMGKFLHMEHSFHPAIALGVLGGAWLMIRHHFRRDEIFQAFLSFWALISFLLYSYAGEKIPWLNVHILLPLALYVATYLPSLWLNSTTTYIRKWAMILLCVCLLSWQGVNTFRASHAMSANPKESLVYTHTSWDIVDLIESIDHMAQASEVGKGLNIQVVGAGAWPLYWYLRSYKRWFYNTVERDRDPWIVVHDWKKREKLTALMGESYHQERVKLREWWVPDLRKMTLRNALHYYFTREPFSILGSQDVVVFIRKDLLTFWPQLISGDNQIKVDRSNSK